MNCLRQTGTVCKLEGREEGRLEGWIWIATRLPRLHHVLLLCRESGTALPAISGVTCLPPLTSANPPPWVCASFGFFSFHRSSSYFPPLVYLHGVDNNTISQALPDSRTPPSIVTTLGRSAASNNPSISKTKHRNPSQQNPIRNPSGISHEVPNLRTHRRSIRSLRLWCCFTAEVGNHQLPG